MIAFPSYALGVFLLRLDSTPRCIVDTESHT